MHPQDRRTLDRIHKLEQVVEQQQQHIEQLVAANEDALQVAQHQHRRILDLEKYLTEESIR